MAVCTIWSHVFSIFRLYETCNTYYCISEIHAIYILTHDSIFLGEDGPTHQPVEHLAALRVIPNLNVIRPADGPEVAASWCQALKYKNGPTAIILTRQKTEAIDRNVEFNFTQAQKGGYIVYKEKTDSPAP